MRDSMQLADFSLRRAIETHDLLVRYAAVDAQQQEVEVHLFRQSARDMPQWNALVKRARLAAMVAHEAVQRIVAVEDFPFGLGARALVRAVGGDDAGALADAEAVEITRGASYFDLALARLAGVLASGRLGDEAGGHRWL